MASNSSSPGRYILSDNTRRAIANYLDLRHQRSRYQHTFKDNSSRIVRDLIRDAHFVNDCRRLPEKSTCSTVHNHPDPCDICWDGGYHTDFPRQVAMFQASLIDVTKRDPAECPGDTSPCRVCRSYTCPHKHHCWQYLPRIAEEPEKDDQYQEQGRQDLIQNDSGSTGVYGEWEKAKCNTYTDIKQTDKIARHAYYKPWEEIRHDAHNVIPSRVDTSPCLVNGKLPQYQSTYPLQNCVVNPSCMGNMQFPQYDCTAGIHNQATHGVEKPFSTRNIARTIREQSHVVYGSPDSPYFDNNWTFRDENNLRVPCMSQTYGYNFKHDLQKKFHREHPDAIPDRRNFTRFPKRSFFHGFHSYFYH